MFANYYKMIIQVQGHDLHIVLTVRGEIKKSSITCSIENPISDEIIRVYTRIRVSNHRIDHKPELYNNYNYNIALHLSLQPAVLCSSVRLSFFL